MKNVFLLATLGLLAGCASQPNWRDNCEANFTSESGEYHKCVRARERRQAQKKREEVKRAASAEKPAVGLKHIDLPRIPKDYGRVPDTGTLSDATR